MIKKYSPVFKKVESMAECNKILRIFFHNTCKMVKIFKKEIEDESLNYIKYKKYSTKRAKIWPENRSDQYLAMFKSNSKFNHL